jgi:16S rRNA (cytidine1402-2'-O)-methyltransferase
VETLHDIREVLGERRIVVARELTKIYEELVRGGVSEVIEFVAQGKVRGEVVILVAPGEIVAQAAEPLTDVLQRIIADGNFSVKDLAIKASEITGVSRNKAYAEALRLRNNAD